MPSANQIVQRLSIFPTELDAVNTLRSSPVETRTAVREASADATPGRSPIVGFATKSPYAVSERLSVLLAHVVKLGDRPHRGCVTAHDRKG